MHAQLEVVVSAFERARARLHRLADSMPDDRWNQRRDPGRWSVAECIAHLNLTSRAYLPLLSRALDEAPRDLPVPGRFHRDAAGWLLSILAGPLPELRGLRIGRVTTPPAFVPEGDLPRAEVAAEFDRLQAEQIALARAGDGLPLDRIRIASPFDPRVRYNVYSAFVILPRHQERHLRQAERVWE